MSLLLASTFACLLGTLSFSKSSATPEVIRISSGSQASVVRHAVGEYFIGEGEFHGSPWFETEKTSHYLFRNDVGRWGITNSEDNVKYSKALVIMSISNTSDTPFGLSYRFYQGDGIWEKDLSFGLTDITNEINERKKNQESHLKAVRVAAERAEKKRVAAEKAAEEKVLAELKALELERVKAAAAEQAQRDQEAAAREAISENLRMVREERLAQFEKAQNDGDGDQEEPQLVESWDEVDLQGDEEPDVMNESNNTEDEVHGEEEEEEEEETMGGASENSISADESEHINEMSGDVPVSYEEVPTEAVIVASAGEVMESSRDKSMTEKNEQEEEPNVEQQEEEEPNVEQQQEEEPNVEQQQEEEPNVEQQQEEEPDVVVENESIELDQAMTTEDKEEEDKEEEVIKVTKRDKLLSFFNMVEQANLQNGDDEEKGKLKGFPTMVQVTSEITHHEIISAVNGVYIQLMGQEMNEAPIYQLLDLTSPNDQNYLSPQVTKALNNNNNDDVKNNDEYFEDIFKKQKEMRYLYLSKSYRWTFATSEGNMKSSRGAIVSTSSVKKNVQKTMLNSFSPLNLKFVYFDEGKWLQDLSFKINEISFEHIFKNDDMNNEEDRDEGPDV